MNSTFCTPKKMIPSSAPPTAASFLFVDQQHHHQNSSTASAGTSTNSFCTPGSVKRTNRFHLMPMINRTPISRLNRAIVNPFEASLNERLHLPMICSPSLFHRPATPQMSSTQFEWTIDDVASLGPANVEADETQFVMNTDPELEARAQEAITSYFKGNVILPSPISCPLREASAMTRLLPEDPGELLDLSQQRRESLENLAAANNKSQLKRIKVRDGTAQTVLTFPPKLPKEVENLLAAFCTYTQEQQEPLCEEEQYSSHNDSSNASLRRKLFETSLNSDELSVSKQEETEALERQLQLEHEEQQRLLRDVRPMGTPELKLAVKTRSRHFGSPTDNKLELSETKKESFGSLSPILSSNGSTPAQATPAMKGHHSSSTSSLYRSTPERMTSMYRSVSINSVEMHSVHGSAMKMGGDRDEQIDKDNSAESDMHVSHWSSCDVTGNRSLMFLSSQNDDLQRTPVRRQNKSASRKNLSRSFSQILNEEFGEDENNVEVGRATEAIRRLPSIHSELISVTVAEDDDEVFVRSLVVEEEVIEAAATEKVKKNRLFVPTHSVHVSDSMYRTDSGFNDEDLTSNSARSGNPSFSTPSGKLPRERLGLAMMNQDDVSMRSLTQCD